MLCLGMSYLKKTISERNFQVLVAQFKKVQEQSISHSSDSKLSTYWNYGDLIDKQKLSDAAGYHNSVLKDLSLATGISLRVLQQSLAFRKSYKTPPLKQSLTWSHLRLLSSLKKQAERSFYTKLIRQKNWTARELQKAISADLYSGGTVEEPVMNRPTEPSYLYKCKEVRVIDGDTFEALIDLGFNSFSSQRLRLAQIDCPELPSAQGRAARNFVTEQLTQAKTIVVQTRRVDVHGRFVAHVFLASQKVSVDTCFFEGAHLNDMLVRKGHAELLG